MLSALTSTRILIQLVAALLVLVAIAASAAAQATDHLGVPGPIEFDGRSYDLAWSSRPAENYIKQEYVPSGQSVETYAQMLLVEVVTGNVSVMDAVQSQIQSLNERKTNDPLVNMSVIRNESTGEALLDFIVSSKDAAGNYIIEWNAYRYAPYNEASGKSGVLLYAISHRAYGNEDAKAFLSRLKAFRPTQIDVLTKAPLPFSDK